MKRLTTAAAVLAASLFVGGCTTITPPSYVALATGGRMELTGEASATFLFGVIPLPYADISVATAASNGGITRVATVDSKTRSILGIVVTKTTIVTGDTARADGQIVSAKSTETGASGSFTIDVATLGAKLDENIYVVNATNQNALPVTVEVRQKSEQRWRKQAVRTLDINKMERFDDVSLKKAEQIRITPPFAVQTRINAKGDELFVLLFTAEPAKNIDYTIDRQEISFYDYLRMTNETSDANIGFDVYARNAESDDWTPIGAQFFKDKASNVAVQTVYGDEVAKKWRYFAFAPRNGKSYRYRATVARNDLIITVLEK